MKITGLSQLFKWENLHNWWLTKYFFAPLYVWSSVVVSCLVCSAVGVFGPHCFVLVLFSSTLVVFSSALVLFSFACSTLVLLSSTWWSSAPPWLPALPTPPLSPGPPSLFLFCLSSTFLPDSCLFSVKSVWKSLLKRWGETITMLQSLAGLPMSSSRRHSIPYRCHSFWTPFPIYPPA